MELKPNLGNLFGRSLMLVILVLLEITLIYHHAEHRNRTIFGHLKSKHFYYFLLVWLPLIFALVLVTFFGIIRIEVEEFSDTIVLKKFFSETIISIKEISNYSITVKRNSFRTIYGLLLTLNNGKTIQLAPQNIGSLDNFKAYLIQKEIPFLKETRPKFPFR